MNRVQSTLLAAALLLPFPAHAGEGTAPPGPPAATQPGSIGPKPAARPPAAPSRLVVRSKAEHAFGRGPSDYGLTGREKPGGADVLGMRLRASAHPEAPAFATAPLEVGDATFEPVIVDRLDDGGWLTFYRDNPGAGYSYVGADFLVVLRTAAGGETARVHLDPYLLTPDTEVQDVRHRAGVLYFNEACGTYARDYRSRCSTLVAYDLAAGRVLWRTPWLTSNNLFIFWDDATLVTGYGFTAEPDHLYLVDTKTGRVLSRTRLDSAHAYLERMGDELHVLTTNRHYVMTMKPGKGKR